MAVKVHILEESVAVAGGDDCVVGFCGWLQYHWNAS